MAVPRDRRASGPGLHLRGLGEATLATVHADAAHLSAAGAVEGTGDPADAVASQVAAQKWVILASRERPYHALGAEVADSFMDLYRPCCALSE